VDVVMVACPPLSGILSSRQAVYRRIFTRFEKLDVMFVAFINFALIVDGLR